jgi:Mn2+/Fe2+ NRAMP family transporter
VINGMVSVPVMAMTMFIGTNRKIMGEFAISGMLKIVGWIATAVMGAAAIGMIAASVSS